MTSYNVGHFVGSLSAASIKRLLSKALIRLAPPELQMAEIPYRDLPLYNRDHDADYPLVAREFKNSIAFTRKPSAVIGTSPGKIGTAIGQQHLRSILSFCNSPQMNSIEAYIQFEPGLITDDGEVTNGTTADFFRTYMKEFHGFIARVYTVLPRNP